MNNIILDSSAWIEYFKGTEKGEKIKKYVDANSDSVYSNGIIVAEVCSKFLKDGSSNTEKAFNIIISLSKSVNLNFDIGFDSSKTYISHRKNNNKFSLIDSIILTLAKSINGKVITCDSDFVGINDAVFIK